MYRVVTLCIQNCVSVMHGLRMLNTHSPGKYNTTPSKKSSLFTLPTALCNSWLCAEMKINNTRVDNNKFR